MNAEIKLEGYGRMLRLVDPKTVNTAARRALGTAVRDGRATAADAIYKKWNIKKPDLNRAVKAVKVRRESGGFVASVYAKGRPMSLTYFGAKWFRPRSVTTRQKTTLRKRRTGKRGVYAQIMRGGEVTHKPNAFIAAVKTKRSDIHHIGVFERIKGSHMASNPDKEKIVERKLITMASMFGQPDVIDPTIERIEQSWNREFPRQIDLLFGG